MLVEHLGCRPSVHPSACVAPNAVLSGDVRVGAHCRILFGAVLTASGGPVVLGERTIVMENAVLRGTRRHPLRIGSHCLVGPRASLSGCTVADDVFLATGVTVFNGARIDAGAEVRVNAVVHVGSIVGKEVTVPIGWVVVGDQVLSPDQHERIWSIQEGLDFPGVVFGLERAAAREFMPRMTARYTRALATHIRDVVVDDS